MIKKLLLFLFCCIFMQNNILFGMEETMKIENYSFNEGLTASTVNSVYQDSKGFLWICSNNGLFRYDGYNFRNINSIVNGFLKYEPSCIAEDKDQNFWIGTAGNGIYYYNTHTGSLSALKLCVGNSMVYRIRIFQNKIWIATGAGLLVADEHEIYTTENLLKTKVLLFDIDHKAPQSNSINDVYLDKNTNSVWVATNSFLFELNSRTYSFHIVNSNNQNSIRSLAKYNHKIIVGSWDGGIFAVNPLTSKLENDDFIDDINKTIGDKRVKSVLLDDRHRCWVATYGNGLYIFEKKQNGNVTFNNYHNNGNVRGYLNSDFINQLYLDKYGIVWVAMNQAALSKMYIQKNNFQYYNIFLSDNENRSKEILALNQSTDLNKLWVTINGCGIYLFDTKDQNFKHFSRNSTALQLQNDDVSLCYQDKKGNLWIVYHRIGLYVVPSSLAMGLLDGKSTKTIRPIDANRLTSIDWRRNSYITTFYEDNVGKLWIGAWGSLHVVDLKRGFSFIKNTDNLLAESKSTCVYTDEYPVDMKFPISPVYSIVELNKGTFWLGTNSAGITQIDEVSTLNFIGKGSMCNDQLPSNNVRGFLKDGNYGLWIGTNAGLCYYNLKNHSFKTLTIKDGLNSEDIYSIIEDKKQNIWVTTSNGISRINEKNFSVLNFRGNKKVGSNQFIVNSIALTESGKLCFSTNEAIVMVNPDSIEINRNLLPLYLTDIRIDNKSVTPLQEYKGTRIIEPVQHEIKKINVPYNHNLSIEFAALDFLNPEQIQYKYKIGNNTEWILLNTGQRSLILPNMNSGEYILSVMVANSSCQHSVRCIKINYMPPFWLSKLAYFFYFVIVLLFLFLLRRIAIQKIHQKLIIEHERFERKKLQELDKMKSEFFSNISHEFRTPLSLIINPLERLVKDEGISEKNKSKINLILKSSSRLLKLTNELMDFSKIEKKLLVPDFHLCELVTFTNEICQYFINLADSMNIDFKTNFSFERIEIPIDRGMIEKVIFNLLSNAFKYTTINGVIMVNISKCYFEDNEFVKITVINTGETISKENLNKIFDRYYQVNNVQNKGIEGTGIGLSLVKSFVDLHHGIIEVKSEPNLETCFDIYLPILQKDYIFKNELITTHVAKINKELNSNNSAINIINKPSFHYRLLLIEDEEDIRNYILEEFSADFKIVTAKDGEEGLKIANEIIPDLIITDIMMPLISGIDLCNKLKNQMITSHIPIIILSAKAGIPQQIEGIQSGADVYMVKPFNIDHLKAQILRLINFKQTIYSRYLKENTLIPKGTLTTLLDEEFMRKVLSFIEENITNADLNVDQLANYVSLSKVQTYRKVKAISGLSIVEFIRTVRLKKASKLVLEGNLNYSEIAFETGFSTPSYFSKCFHDHFGMSPSEYALEYGEKKDGL